MNVVINPQAVLASAEVANGNVIITPQIVGVDVIANELDAVIGFPIIREISGGEIYDGDYVITPTNEDQTFPTYGKLMARDLVVEKIPSNYGLISWNGAVLTVS